MTARVINDPSALGWEFDPATGRWEWGGSDDGGGSGGSGGGGLVHGDIWVGTDIDLEFDEGQYNKETMYLVMPLTWTEGYKNTSLDCTDVAYGNGLWCVVGGQSGNYPISLFSSDGKAWEMSSNLQSAWGAVYKPTGVASNGSYFCAVGSTKAAISTDGSNWTDSSTSQVVNGNMVIAWGADKFVAIGAGGRVITSPDGVDWTEGDSIPTSESAKGIKWNGKHFIAFFSRGGAIYTSPDGVTWTAQPGINFPNSTSSFLRDVAWDGNRWLVVGRWHDGTSEAFFATSPDGVAWTRHEEINDVTSASEFNTVTVDSGRILVTLGSTPKEGMYSLDGVHWMKSDAYSDASNALSTGVCGLADGELRVIVHRQGISYEGIQNVISAEEGLTTRLLSRLKERIRK